MYSDAAIDTRTNAVMRKVYVRMFLALLVTAFCALGVASSPALSHALLGNQIIFWGMAIGMLAIAWIVPSRLERMSTGATLLWFFVFSALMGVWTAPIFLVYRLGTIAYTFFIAAGTFGAMSLYGYFTKANLNRLGSFCMMGLFGIIIAIVVNLFLKSSAVMWWVSIVGVLIFLGLTAWDTQQVRKLAALNMDPALTDKLATMGAMNLYLDFINLFLFLLRIFGGGRD